MRKAFTLIELLVVIAIIAILAAILFPVFAQAKEAAKKTVCLSNMKEIGTAAYLYAGDSEDVLPNTTWHQDVAGTPYYNPANPAAKYEVHWTYLMQPYIKNWDIFVCPSDTDPTEPKNGKCTNGIADLGKVPMVCDWQAQKSSYVSNYNLLPVHDSSPVSMTVLDAPADTVLVGERRRKMENAAKSDITGQKGMMGFLPAQPCPSAVYTASISVANPGKNYSIYRYYTVADAQASLLQKDDTNDIVRVKWDRHTGGANYAYADGHAKKQPYKKLTVAQPSFSASGACETSNFRPGGVNLDNELTRAWGRWYDSSY